MPTVDGGQTPGALDGLSILDFSRILAGPFATMMLGDLGAEVTKIERPGTGDDTRSWGPPFDATGAATYFQAVNRNKTSLAIDLSDPAGRRAPGGSSPALTCWWRTSAPASWSGSASARQRAQREPGADLLLDHRLRARRGRRTPRL